MPKSMRYPLLEIRDIMINILKNDSDISSVVTYKDSKSKEEFIHIYKTSLDEIKIPISRAISVYYFGDKFLSNKAIQSIDMYESPIYVGIFCQDLDKNKAIEDCIKLAEDISNTFWESNLKKYWEYKLTDQRTVTSELKQSIYTHILLQEYTGIAHATQYKPLI